MPAILILASASPRRRELLDQIGVSHEVRPVDVDETPHPGEPPAAFARRMARAKALAGARVAAGRAVLGADTVVSIDGDILGKPRDREHALAMLGRLSGQTHVVYTAVALARGERIRDTLSVTRVRFKALSLREQEAYWASGEPVDKAGAYGIQGRGALFVEYIEGSYSGVVGLPLFETGALLSGD